MWHYAQMPVLKFIIKGEKHMQKRFFKKAGSVILASALLCGSAAVVLPQVAQTGIEAQAANSGTDFIVCDWNGGVSITKYIGTSSNVIIPSKIDGKNVVELAADAFEDNRTITSVVIPSTVTCIGGLFGGETFRGCTKLKSIIIPDSVKSIGMSVFENCTSLESVTLPKETNESGYGQSIFKGCTSLKKINFQNWTSIPNGMFSECNFTSFTVPNTIKYIDNFAFSYCKNLVSVSIPNTVTEMGENVFADCTSLKKVSLSNTMISIPRFSFTGCTALEEIIIPNGVESIGYAAFENCVHLKKIIIPDTVTEISNYAFCSGYTETDICSPNLVIYGKKNSEAERFAKSFNVTFKPIIATTGVVFNTSSIALDVKGTYKINATVKPSDATINTLTWKTSNASIATVSADGTVTAKGSGIATITATTADNKTAKCTVTVYGSPTSISLSNAQMTLGKNETTKLTATVGPQYAKDKTVKWRTSDSKVLTVDQKGNVKAVGIGTAWITATANGNSKLAKSCKITVNNAPTKITLTKGILTIGVGEKYTLGAGINDGAGCAKRTYRTSNSSVVKMTRTDWNGDFYGVKPGVAYVTVKTYNGKESTCKVTVKAAPTSVTISKKTLTLKVGQSASLSCSIPSTAGCATRTFRTSNSNVVKMTKTNWTGSFKAVAPGTAYVTVRTYNGKESTCKVTVTR